MTGGRVAGRFVAFHHPFHLQTFFPSVNPRQTIAFFAGLAQSDMFHSALVVCPATVMRQWVRDAL